MTALRNQHPTCLTSSAVWATLLIASTSGILQSQDGLRRAELGVNGAQSAKRLFAQVEAVREISDGRVIVLDRRDRENLLSWIEFGSGAVTGIGRVGSGPGEYQRPRSLVGGPADTSFLSDLALQRWLRLDGVAVRSSVRADQSPVRELGMVLSGGDRMGHVLSIVGIRPVAPLPALAHAESLLVLLGSVLHGDVDTIARMPGVRAKFHRIQFADTLGTSLTSNPLLIPDQATLLVDGWIAIAHQSPYRVDWRRPDGRWIWGAELERRATELTSEDKRAALLDRYGWRAENAPVSIFDDWPERRPAFLSDALTSTPAGCVAVRRTAFGTNVQVEYDVIDRSGALASVVEIEGNQRIVGFGNRGVYVTTADSDGLLTLTRYPLPPGPCFASAQTGGSTSPEHEP